jgi:hypothetical protein
LRVAEEDLSGRNGWIFNNIYPSVEGCRRRFITEFSLTILGAKPGLVPAMESWVHSL